MHRAFVALIEGGASNLAMVDVYMGGTTGRALRDTIFKPILRDHPGITFKTYWIRETMGLGTEESGGTTLQPNTAKFKDTQPNADRVTTAEIHVRLALGDDMTVVLDGDHRAPIVIFDRRGRIVRKLTPRGGQTTRQLLVELLTS
ncbi:hypothetical protein Acsp02_96310 [Actinoplanes sp. NBRC 103695]|nr:hypothetical protein Acsp02_96310 [Actinoplanes sp. NBRC 103695]